MGDCLKVNVLAAIAALAWQWPTSGNPTKETDMQYITPQVTEIGSFKSLTKGVWFGRWRDIFGGRAFIKVEIG